MCVSQVENLQIKIVRTIERMKNVSCITFIGNAIETTDNSVGISLLFICDSLSLSHTNSDLGEAN